MKIVLPVHHFPPHYSAGAELYTLRLARWLLVHGHEVEVVCVERINHGDEGELLAEYDNYQDVPVWRLSFNLNQAAATFDWSYANPLIGRWFAGYLERFRPDLVHLQSGYLLGAGVLEAARVQGVPTALTLHDFWFICPRITLLRGDGQVCEKIPTDPGACAWCMLLDSRRYRLPDQMTGGLVGRAVMALSLANPRKAIAERRACLNTALEWTDAVIAPTDFLKKVFTATVPTARVEVVRLGIDTAQLQQTPPPQTAGALRVGYIGQISAYKGVHLLVRAVQLLSASGRPVELTIYGDLERDPVYSRRLKQMIGHNDAIRLAGRFENGRIAEVMGSCDVMVAPSVWYENSPLAILEAQAAARPVIVSAMGGMAELVKDGVNGLHFRPGDAVDLARQIQRLRDEPDLLVRLSQGAQPPPTVDDEMQTLLGVYQRLVEQGVLAAKEAA